MNAQDRCDACPAQAYVKVMFKTGELLFCGHHYDHHSPAFPDHMIVEDERNLIVAARSG